MLKYKTATLPLRGTDNSFDISGSKIAEVFISHLAKTFQPQENILWIYYPQHVGYVTFLDSSLRNAHAEKYFIPNQVKNMILKYSSKKSPEFDLITAEVARCLPKKTIILLTNIFNAILRFLFTLTMDIFVNYYDC